jgi:hypothetical protein
MGNSDTIFPRPEAGSIRYWKHHKRNRDALDFIIRVLKGAADSVSGSKGIAGAPTIDTNRASRIVFVSGEPGSGKTTLYLTLKAMLSSEEKENYRVGCKINLNDLAGIRWLDTLDLEVAGDEGENLLAAVLVRLFRKLGETDPVHSKSCEDAIKELEELATDIGIAWEGNLQARAGALDPDTYSAEVMRTQRARLRVNERLKEALDKLAQQECYGCSSGTLFVLPVDDFYLKPAASLQLLRLLRMISIPRLFFLVMGDIDTVEALFIEKSLADWTAVAGTRLFAERSDRLDEALTRARELRARYLRKLLPMGQRAEIEVMDWHEALDLEVGRSENNPTDAEPLETILASVQLDRPNDNTDETDSLLSFLISPFLPPVTSEEGRQEKEKRVNRAKGEEGAKESTTEIDLKKHRSAYTALQILDATPREMMDLAAALREVQRQREKLKIEGTLDEDTNKIPLLLLCVKDMVNLVREEQSFLNEKQQKILEGILPTRHYSAEDINFKMDRLCLHPSPRTWKEQYSGQVWFRDHRSWDLTVNSKLTDDSKKKSKNKSTTADEKHGMEEDDDKDPFAKLPPRPAAWFVLLHDLAWRWNPDSVTGNLVEKMCDELSDWQLSKSEVTSPPNQETCLQPKQRSNSRQTSNLDPSVYLSGGWAVWVDASTYKHFPMPKFEMIRDLDRFLHVWSRGLMWLGKPEEAKVDKVFSLWALAGLTVLANAFEHFAEGSDEWFRGFAETTGTFEERFGKVKDAFKEKGKTIEYPGKDEAEIARWLKCVFR